MAIWIQNFPLPPSVNQYLMPVKGRLVKTKMHRDYADRCELWARQNQAAVNQIVARLHSYSTRVKGSQVRFGFRVDMFFVFHVERLWTKNNLAENLDADNRLKPCRDVLAKMLGIDDKWFFSGFFEKVSTQDKDKECTLIRITPMVPRRLEEVRSQMKQESLGATSY